MGKSFGPMRGAYDGAYPEEEEAFRLIREGGARLPERWSPEGLGLPRGADHDKLRIFVFHTEYEDAVFTADYLGQTLIVGNSKRVLLVARSTGQAYATYDSEW